jgi:hypothetical protein
MHLEDLDAPLHSDPNGQANIDALARQTRDDRKLQFAPTDLLNLTDLLAIGWVAER